MASSFSDAVKRLLVGRPFRSDYTRQPALPKRLAMPVFASDMLSSVAYAPDEILLALSVSGLVALTVSPWVGLAVGGVILLIVACYRLNLRAQGMGGGDYEIARKNLGSQAGLAVAASLLVDYVLTLAVSMTVFASYIGSISPTLKTLKVPVAILGILFITMIGLRGGSRLRRVVAFPTYLFLGAVGLTVLVGLIRVWSGDVPQAETSSFMVVDTQPMSAGMVSFASAFIVLRAFSSGSVALAGVQTVATAVPRFTKPRGSNASTTLLVTGVLSASMLVGITWLASVVDIKYVLHPHEQLVSKTGGAIAEDFVQTPVLGQLAQAVFSGAPLLFYMVVIVTSLVLVVAANTAVEGFPGLASRLAMDGFLPRQLATRGDRMTFSNGIFLLSVGAIVLIIASRASAPELIELYLVGVFASFVMGQLGMVRYWSGKIRSMVSSPKRRRLQFYRVVNAVGFGVTGLVFVVVVITKFFTGAWIAVAAMFVLYVGMGLISRHYERVDRELAPQDDDSVRTLPSNTHAVVIVTDIHKPMLRAISFARGSRPTFLSALCVAVDEEKAQALQQQWDDMRVPVPLTILDSPYRELVRPVMNHIAEIRSQHPRDLIIVYIPQYIVGRWWENMLHNQTSLRLRSRLLIVPNVVVAIVPWRLQSFNRNRDYLLRRAGDLDSRAWKQS